MNPYEANLTNIAARIGAWNRGMLRRYRWHLWALAAATVTMAVSIGSANAPAAPVTIAAR